MAKLNKTCIMCNEKYTYCPNCNSKKYEPTWKNIFCSENCKEIYDICVGARDNEITINEANDKLNKCDLSNLSNFSDGFKNRIENIKNDFKKSESKNITEVKEPKEKKFFKKDEN